MSGNIDTLSKNSFYELPEEEQQKLIESITEEDEEKFLEIQRQSTKISIIYIISTYGSLNITKMAKILGKSKGTIHPHVKELFKEGYIQIDPDPDKWGKYYQLSIRTQAIIEKQRIDFDVDAIKKEIEELKKLDRRGFVDKIINKMYREKRELVINLEQYVESSIELTHALKRLSVTETAEKIKNMGILGLMRYIKEENLSGEEIKRRINEFSTLAKSDNIEKEIENLETDNVKNILEFISDRFLSVEHRSTGRSIIEDQPFEVDDLLKYPIGEFNDLMYTLKLSNIDQLTRFEEATLEYFKKLTDLRNEFEQENKHLSIEELDLQFVNIFMGPIGQAD